MSISGNALNEEGPAPLFVGIERQLPRELDLCILSYLPPVDLVRFAKVSKEGRFLAGLCLFEHARAFGLDEPNQTIREVSTLFCSIHTLVKSTSKSSLFPRELKAYKARKWLKFLKTRDLSGTVQNLTQIKASHLGPIYQAIGNREFAGIQAFNRVIAHVNPKLANGEAFGIPLKVILDAINADNVPFLNYCMENRIKLNALIGNTSLIAEAVKAEAMGVIELLSQYGANLNLSAPNENPPLFIALEKCSLTCTALLIKNGANHKLRNQEGETTLTVAVEKSFIQAIELLLAAGAELNFATTKGITPLALAVERKDKAVIEVLLRHGADPAHKAPQAAASPFILAVTAGLIDIVALLLMNGVDVNGIFDGGKTALAVAIKNSNKELIQFLLENGANIDQVAGGMTPLMYFCRDKRNENWVVEFLENNPTLMTHSYDGKQAIHYAAMGGSLKIVQALLDENVDHSPRDHNGKTPLAYAIRTNCVPLVALLTEAGAKI